MAMTSDYARAQIRARREFSFMDSRIYSFVARRYLKDIVIAIRKMVSVKISIVDTKPRSYPLTTGIAITMRMSSFFKVYQSFCNPKQPILRY